MSNSPLPKTLEEARGLLIPSDINRSFKVPLPLLLPEMGTERFKLVNFHPALTDLTANTHGVHASKRILKLRADKTAWTMHAVAQGVDTGPKIAVRPVDVPYYSKDLEGEALETAAQQLFTAVQGVEKMFGPVDLANHYARHEAWLQKQAA